MPVTQYIGSRYVPLFADPVEWSSTKTYEPLTIVLHQGNSFTSKQFVPVGIDIDNTEFWAETGNYNAQVEQYRREVLDFADTITQKAFSFDTALEMQRSQGLYIGAICHTNGFHATNDNGGAWYVIEAGEPNNKDVLSCGEYVARFKHTDLYVTPEMFGAYGDGVTDDTASLQFAIDYAYENHLQARLTGKYLVTEPIKIYGVSSTTSSFGTVLFGTVDAEIVTKLDINVLELTPKTDATRAYGIKIYNLMINGSNRAPVGIHSSYACAASTFENITIKNCTTGIHIDANCYLNTFDSIRTYNTSACGILLTNGNNTSNVFTKCYVDTAGTAYKLNGQYSTLISCCADVITGNVFELSSFNGSMVGCGSEAHQASCMFKIGTGTVLNITGGFFYALDATDVYYFDIANGSNVQVNAALINYTSNSNTPNSMAKLAYQAKLNLRNVGIQRPFANEDSVNANATLVVNTGVSTVTETVTLDEYNEASLSVNASRFAVLDVYTSRSGWTLLWWRASSSTYKIRICGQADYNPTIPNKEFPLTITCLAKNSV